MRLEPKDPTATLIVLCRIDPGRFADLAEVAEAFEASAPPGSLERGAWTKVGDPGAYCLIERWSDLASLDAHRASDAHRALISAIESVGTVEAQRVVVGAPPRADDAPTLAELAAHDLRNSLAAVTALVLAAEERLEDAELATEAVDLQVARAECRRMSRMLSELLVRSRIERKRFHPMRQATALRAFLELFTRTVLPRAAPLGIAVEVDADDTVAMLDGELVHRLLENLVDNALRHAPAGGRIQVSGRADGDALVRLAVRNTGPEIPARLQATLFQPDGLSAGGGGGTRLGLFVCRLVAEAHGGTIGLVERAGWGVSFEVLLPLGT